MDKVEQAAREAEAHYIDMFRILRSAGRSDAGKAKEASQYVAEMILAEREACAMVADHYNFGPERDERDNARNAISQIIATAIRSRTETTDPSTQENAR